MKVFVCTPCIDQYGVLEPLRQHPSIEVDAYDGPGPACPRDEFLRRIKGVDGIILFPKYKMDKEAVEAAGPSLKVVATTSSGYDHIDLDLMRSKGIRVGISGNALVDSLAEFTVGLTLTTLHKIQEMNRRIMQDQWNFGGRLFDPTLGTSLYGKVISIIGLGRVGTEVSNRLRNFKVKKILYNSRTEKPQLASSCGASFVSFEEAVTQGDIVILTCSLNESTQGLFHKGVFEKMKSTASIINIGRGALINQDDLVQALKNGTIRSAGLDVMTPEPLPPTDELANLPNATLTPHIGSATVEARVVMAEVAVQNILAVLTGEGQMPEPMV